MLEAKNGIDQSGIDSPLRKVVEGVKVVTDNLFHTEPVPVRVAKRFLQAKGIDTDPIDRLNGRLPLLECLGREVSKDLH